MTLFDNINTQKRSLRENKKKRIEQLVPELNHHSMLYYERSAPEIEDSEFDSLMRELLILEQDTGYVLPNSPTQHVGFPVHEKFKAVRHAEKLYSLDNAFTEQDVYDFYERVKKLAALVDVAMSVDIKYDGLTLSNTYASGILTEAATRGDGLEGESVLHNALVIETIPKRLIGDDIPPHVEVRGEVCLPKAEFERLNKEREAAGEPLYANPRNAAAGSLRLLDPEIAKTRGLIFVPHGIGPQNAMPQFSTVTEVSRWFKSVGFTLLFDPRPVKNIGDAISVIAEIEAIRADLPFDIDGAVLKTLSLTTQEVIGYTNKTPRHSIAYKFPPERVITQVKGIVVQVGRSGQLSPVAELVPICCAGSKISRCTLHNFDELARKDIRVSDFITLYKAGDVIPAIEGVIMERRPEGTNPFEAPTHCPVCGSAITKGDEVVIFCENVNCSAQVLRRLSHFGSRDALDIENLGSKTVEALFTAGLIHHFTDLYRLKKDDIVKLPGFAEKSAQLLIDAIEKSKTTTMARFLYSLGVPNFGRTASRLISERFEHIGDMYHIGTDALININQIGESIAGVISGFFGKEENIAAIEEMKAAGLILSNPDYAAAKEAGPRSLSGNTFVITGTHEVPRKEIEDQVKKAGGKISGSVSKKTDYLIAGEDPGGKLAKAQECGVKVINYSEFTVLIGRGKI
ncbi:MAG: NAD-dependent DNA ligase LigA [Dissulfurispiraceae bacterium]